MSKKVDMIGKRFGRLTVTRESEHRSGKRKRLMYYCDCDCGNKDIEVIGEKLRSGHTKSCGCLAEETKRKMHKNYNKYDISGEYGVGWTSNTNKEFYFDLEDYDKIKNYCWRETKNNYIVTTNEYDKIIFLHRFVMNVNDEKYVDHKQHNTYDNRKSLLRVCTPSNNAMNERKRKDNTSGHTGVWWSKQHEMWIAEIMINQKKIHLGMSKHKEEAVKIRLAAEEKYFKEWSYKNSVGKYNNEV